MPCDFTYIWNLKKEKEMNEQNRYQFLDTEKQTDGCQMRGVLGGWVKVVKGLRSTNWQLQNSHRDVKYSIGNIVDNIVITTCGARCV